MYLVINGFFYNFRCSIMSEDSRFREGLYLIQHGCDLHTDRRQAGPQRGQWPGLRGGLFTESRGHVPIHPRELHQCAKHGPWPRHVGYACQSYAGQSKTLYFLANSSNIQIIII